VLGAEVLVALAAHELLLSRFLQVEVEEVVQVVPVVEHAWLNCREVGLGALVLGGGGSHVVQFGRQFRFLLLGQLDQGLRLSGLA